MLKLGSVIEYGFGPNTEAISLLYSHLLNKYSLNIKEDILINHIGNDLDEFVRKQGNLIAINIRYPLPGNFNDLRSNEKNSHFAAIIHEALLRLAKQRHDIDRGKLEIVYQEIVSKMFVFEIIYKVWPCKKNQQLEAKIIVRPQMDQFVLFVVIENNNTERCKVVIYKGAPTTLYFQDLFSTGKWKDDSAIIIGGKRSEIEIQLSVNSCHLEFRNKNGDIAKAPIFELFKADADTDKTLQDYISSLNPALAAMIVQSLN